LWRCALKSHRLAVCIEVRTPEFLYSFGPLAQARMVSVPRSLSRAASMGKGHGYGWRDLFVAPLSSSSPRPGVRCCCSRNVRSDDPVERLWAADFQRRCHKTQATSRSYQRKRSSKQQPHRDIENGRRDDIRPRSAIYPNISPTRQGHSTPAVGSLASSPDLEEMAMQSTPLASPPMNVLTIVPTPSLLAPRLFLSPRSVLVSNDPFLAEEKMLLVCHRRSPPLGAFRPQR
jgi:hypothetical protein